jgi:FkbM family methyltransferase
MDFKKFVQTLARLAGYTLRDANYFPSWTDRKIYDHYLRPDHRVRTIFDVGANIGQTAIPFAKGFPDAIIYSFEPFANTFRHLVENSRHFQNIKTNPTALGASDAEVEVAGEPDEADSIVNSLLPEKQLALSERGIVKKQTITVVTGKSYCLRHGIQNVDILKIDTEGFEIPVLDGFGDMLRDSVACILCEFCLLPNKAHQTPLRKLVERLSPDGFELVAVYDIRHEADGAFHYGNALFVHINNLQKDRRW